MENSFSTFLTGPGRYILIIFVVYLLIGLPLTMLYLKKNKAKAKSYLEENPDSAKMMISTRLAFGNLSDALVIIYINNEAPVHFYAKRKLGYFLRPGKNIIEAEASWTRKGLTKTTTTTTGPIKIEVEAEAEKNYNLIRMPVLYSMVFNDFYSRRGTHSCYIRPYKRTCY